MSQAVQPSLLEKWFRSLLGSKTNSEQQHSVTNVQAAQPSPSSHTLDQISSVKADPWWMLRKRAEALVDKVTDETELIVLSGSRDGFVRERALQRLQHSLGPLVLSAAIARLNDFQPEIRAVAKAIYSAHLAKGQVSDFLACMDAVCALQDKTRLDHSALLEQTADLLLQADEGVLLGRIFLETHDKSARLILRWMLARLDKEEVVRLAMSHANPVVRLLAFGTVPALEPLARLALVRTGLDDRYSALRSATLRLVLDSELPSAEKLELCVRRLLDTSGSVRQTASWYAAKSGVDVSAHYEAEAVREDLTSSQRLVLLGEVAKRKSAIATELATALLEHPRAVVRIAAFKVLLRSGGGNEAALLNKAWRDTSSKLRTQVASLVGRDMVLDSESLHEMASSAWMRGDTHVAARLSDNLGSWGKLILDLKLLQHAQTRERALRQIEAINFPQNWLCYSKPYPRDQQQIKALLEIDTVRTDLSGYPNVIDGLDRSGCWPGST